MRPESLRPTDFKNVIKTFSIEVDVWIEINPVCFPRVEKFKTARQKNAK